MHPARRGACRYAGGRTAVSFGPRQEAACEARISGPDTVPDGAGRGNGRHQRNEMLLWLILLVFGVPRKLRGRAPGTGNGRPFGQLLHKEFERAQVKRRDPRRRVRPYTHTSKVSVSAQASRRVASPRVASVTSPNPFPVVWVCPHELDSSRLPTSIWRTLPLKNLMDCVNVDIEKFWQQALR